MSTEGDDLKAFADAARNYCGALNAALELQADEGLPTLDEALAELYGRVHHVPSLELPPEERDSERIPKEEWWATYESLRSALGEFDRFWAPWDPFSGESDKDPLSLADALADIYRDLKEGLQLYDDGRFAEAAFEWRTGFWSHWGRHAVDAIRAIHLLRSEHGWIEYGTPRSVP